MATQNAETLQMANADLNTASSLMMDTAIVLNEIDHPEAYNLSKELEEIGNRLDLAIARLAQIK